MDHLSENPGSILSSRRLGPLNSTKITGNGDHTISAGIVQFSCDGVESTSIFSRKIYVLKIRLMGPERRVMISGWFESLFLDCFIAMS